MFLNDFGLYLVVCIIFILIIFTIRNILLLGNEKKVLTSVLKKEVLLHKHFHSCFITNPMHSIGAMTNKSPYKDSYKARINNNSTFAKYTNYQINKYEIEKFTNQSLQNNNLTEIWCNVEKLGSVIETFVLNCEFVINNSKYPSLVLSDSYNSITTEPVRGLSFNKASKLINKLLIVELEFSKIDANKVRLVSFKETLFTLNGIVDAPTNIKEIEKCHKF